MGYGEMIRAIFPNVKAPCVLRDKAPRGAQNGATILVVSHADASGIAAADADEFANTFAPTRGPIISSVVLDATARPPIITWNVADTAGVACTSISLDDHPPAVVYGPFGSKQNGNYAGVIGPLAPGTIRTPSRPAT